MCSQEEASAYIKKYNNVLDEKKEKIVDENGIETTSNTNSPKKKITINTANNTENGNAVNGNNGNNGNYGNENGVEKKPSGESKASSRNAYWEHSLENILPGTFF